MRLCIHTGITVNELGMDMMLDDEVSITYQRARKMGIARSVKNAWRQEISKRELSAI